MTHPSRRRGRPSADLLAVAAWLVEEVGVPLDSAPAVRPPQPLYEAIVDYVLSDPTGGLHSGTLDRETVIAWIAEESGWGWGPL